MLRKVERIFDRVVARELKCLFFFLFPSNVQNNVTYNAKLLRVNLLTNFIETKNHEINIQIIMN